MFAQTDTGASSSLDQILVYSAANNPEIKEVWHALQVAEQAVRRERSALRPSVDLRGSAAMVEREDITSNDFSSSEYEVRLTQRLFDGYNRKYQISQREYEYSAAYFQYLGQLETTLLQVVVAYIDVLLYRDLLEIAKENLQSHVDVYKQIEESVEAGVGRRADLEQISGRLSLAEANVITEQANLQDVSTRYLRLTGLWPAEYLEPISYEVEAALPLDTAIGFAAAQQKNPQLLAAYYNIQAFRQARGAAKNDNYPKLDFIASYGLQDGNELGIAEDRTEGRVGLELTYNLYDGGLKISNRKSAKFSANRTLENRNINCRNVRQDLQLAYNENINLERQLPSLNEHRLSSARVKTAYSDQFKIGSRTLLDLLDSENEAYEASRAYKQAYSRQQNAQFRMLAVTGELRFMAGFDNGDEALVDTLETPLITRVPSRLCPNTEMDAQWSNGNVLQADDDGDGIENFWDDCESTPVGAEVDKNGCAIPTMPVVMDAPVEVDLATLPVLEKVEIKIQFKKNSDEFLPENLSHLDPLLQSLSDRDDTGIIIEGHASLEGPADWNKTLSEQRAKAVADYLVAATGVPAKRVKSLGLGTERPIINERNEAANEVNRRIEAIVVLLPGEDSIKQPQYQE
ncbi:TolC family protein [Halioxenophilus aromaticivorans]|uniref:TolC family protein n=1 Tax=Halioxenophilus aromaticivorans TaxID=1306992 RepID=UPI0031E554B3